MEEPPAVEPLVIFRLGNLLGGCGRCGASIVLGVLVSAERALLSEGGKEVAAVGSTRLVAAAQLGAAAEGQEVSLELSLEDWWLGW